MNSLGANLRQLRAREGLTQDDLAHRINVNRATIANWEVGRSAPDHATVMSIADMFGVTTDWLLGREGYCYQLAEHNHDPDLLKLWTALLERERLRALCRSSALLSDDALDKIIEVVKMIKE